MAGTPWVFSPESQCHGKRNYPTKPAAKRALKSIKSYGGDQMIVYRCPHCNQWHLGHKHPPRAA